MVGYAIRVKDCPSQLSSLMQKPIHRRTALLILFQDAPSCGPDDGIMLTEKKTFKNTWSTVWSKSSRVRDLCWETQIREDAGPKSHTLLTRTTMDVSAGETIRTDMPSGGGYLIRLTPKLLLVLEPACYNHAQSTQQNSAGSGHSNRSVVGKRQRSHITTPNLDIVVIGAQV